LPIQLPLFAQKTEGQILAVSLLKLSNVAVYLQVAYYGVLLGTIAIGILTLALQNCRQRLWLGMTRMLSLSSSALGVLLLIVGLQPYGAAYLFVFLGIKTFLLLKLQ
jgi:hypothetical protein